MSPFKKSSVVLWVVFFLTFPGALWAIPENLVKDDGASSGTQEYKATNTVTGGGTSGKAYAIGASATTT